MPQPPSSTAGTGTVGLRKEQCLDGLGIGGFTPHSLLLGWGRRRWVYSVLSNSNQGAAQSGFKC